MESKKLRTIYPKNHENFKNNKPRVLLLYKKECTALCKCLTI